MNGIHDMGGMQGLGELRDEETEPVFHEPWEGRMFAMMRGMNVMSGFRLPIEAIPAQEYLRMGYYERWLTAFVEQLVKFEIATRDEIERGWPDPGSARSTPTLTAEQARELPFRTPQSELDLHVSPRFRIGDRVRGRNRHPATHTRMPRYTRGKTGTVERDRGVFELPDNAHYGLDPRPQLVYLIRFEARGLWGELASENDSLYIDMWEDYLEPE